MTALVRYRRIREQSVLTAHVRSVREGVLEELFAGEVLEIRVVDLALARILVGQAVNVLPRAIESRMMATATSMGPERAISKQGDRPGRGPSVGSSA
jgi:hypothetical protein